MYKIGILLISLVLFGCGTTGGGSAEKPEDSVWADVGTYKIGVGDQLNVSVWRNPDLSVSVPVRPDGLISVPLIGDIKASDHEPEQLANNIKAALGNFIKNPQVTVVITGANSSQFLHRVRVTGAVQAPTSVPYQKGMTVMDLVLVTGGLIEFADANNTKLYRTTKSGAKVYTVRMNDILEKGDISTNYVLQPGDIVTVPERLF